MKIDELMRKKLLIEIINNNKIIAAQYGIQSTSYIKKEVNKGKGKK